MWFVSDVWKTIVNIISLEPTRQCENKWKIDLFRFVGSFISNNFLWFQFCLRLIYIHFTHSNVICRKGIRRFNVCVSSSSPPSLFSSFFFLFLNLSHFVGSSQMLIVAVWSIQFPICETDFWCITMVLVVWPFAVGCNTIFPVIEYLVKQLILTYFLFRINAHGRFSYEIGLATIWYSDWIQLTTCLHWNIATAHSKTMWKRMRAKIHSFRVFFFVKFNAPQTMICISHGIYAWLFEKFRCMISLYFFSI